MSAHVGDRDAQTALLSALADTLQTGHAATRLSGLELGAVNAGMSPGAFAMLPAGTYCVYSVFLSS